MEKMNAAVVHEFGDPAQFMNYERTSMPVIGGGDVLIRMIMSPIHNHDVIGLRGEYGVKPELPAIGGSEAVGTIAEIGANVTGITVGTRVAISGAQKVWAEYFVAPATSVAPVPDKIRDEAAAQILGMPMDALLAYRQFNVEAGDWLVLNAASGAIGKVVSAIARGHGVNVAMLVRDETARTELARLGFENVFVTEGEWKDAVREAIGNARVAGGIDMVGGTASGDLVSLVSEFGLILSFGGMSNQPATIDVGEMIFKQVTFRGQWSHRRYQMLPHEEIVSMRSELFELVARGGIILPTYKVFPLAKCAEAMAATAAPHQGKVLLAT